MLCRINVKIKHNCFFQKKVSRFLHILHSIKTYYIGKFLKIFFSVFSKEKPLKRFLPSKYEDFSFHILNKSSRCYHKKTISLLLNHRPFLSSQLR